MNALAGTRLTTLTLPQHPHVLLSGSERIMEGTFGIVTQNLLSLGSCPIENLANSPKADLEGFDLPYVSPDLDLPPGSSAPPPEAVPVFSDDKEKAPDSMQFVAQLHQTCIQMFGNSEALNFEFIEEDGPDHKQCILTISRPNGMTRSYTTEPGFSRKSDAKARAATIAVEMGAIDFVLHGNRDALKSRSKLILAPLDGKSIKQEGKVKEESPVTYLEDDELSKQIQECCVEWRAGQVQPRWIFFSEYKGSTTFGCALIVEISPHSQRAYSVNALYESKPLAKKECSNAAIRQGVLDFIKFGNGQTTPASTPVDPLENMHAKRVPEFEKKGRLAAISLQTFFDTLPKPFPEPIGDKTAASVNAPGMLNTTLQLAKGARLTLQFYFINDNGLHGCIIRLDRPEETRTYIVDPKFAKRADAKAAVCLLAMSQGISQYIRSVAAAVENRITPEMRKRANEQILPILGSEYAKLRHGMHPTYEFDHDQGAFGCTMSLSLSADPKPEEIRKWSIKPEYRTKTDAKIAVVYLAGQEAIEFVRFRGEPVPPDHDPFKPYKRAKEQPQSEENEKKEETSRASPTRSAAEQWPSSIPKRPVTTSGLVRLGLPNVPLLETKEEAMARQRAESWRWQQDRHQAQQRPLKRQSAFSSFANPPPPPLSAQPIPGPSRPPVPPQLCNGPSSNSHLSYDVVAAATAVIDRLTGSSASDSPPPLSQPPRPSQHPQPLPSRPPQHPSHPVWIPPPPHHPTPQQQQRPPRQRRSRRTSQPPLTQRQSYVAPQPARSIQHSNSQSPSQQHSPFAVPQPPQPAQPSLQTIQQFSPYGASHLPQPQQHSPYGANPYQAGYPQPAYPFPGVSFPTTPAGYSSPPIASPPTASHAFGAYHAYAAYYADPRYAQYSMPGMPLSYAVPVPPPTPGFPYPFPPPPGAAATPTHQWGTPAAPPPHSPAPDGQSSPSGNETVITPTRTASFSAGSDRQKRPRSREGSPEEAQQHKKQRSESALPSIVNVKRESTSASPPSTPMSASNKPSSVEQLLEYCGSEGIAWPEFGSKQMKNEHGEDVFKVWIVMGNERLELPIAFPSENEGRQRVARQVLQRLRSQSGHK